MKPEVVVNTAAMTIRRHSPNPSQKKGIEANFHLRSEKNREICGKCGCLTLKKVVDFISCAHHFAILYPSKHPMNDKARRQTILSVLSQTYPRARIVLRYRTPWELLIAVILSAQCTDVMVNIVTKKLFQKYPTFKAYCKADPKEFEKDIRSTGFYHNKAKNILAAAALLRDKFNGCVPKTMEEILTLPGVARKTANVVLGNAYGVVEGIAVDTHVLRLSQRLRLVPFDAIGGKKALSFKQRDKTIIDYKKDANPLKIEAELMKIIPKSRWFSLTYQLIDHGRALCKAKKPTCCNCPLQSFCPTAR
jgi:endonuclease-3